MTIIDAIEDPHLFAPLFKDAASWRAWKVVLKAIFGLSMDESERTLFTHLTGRHAPPTAQAREVWLCIGRRGGKSRIVALIAVFLACFRAYDDYLSAGERGVLMIVATDRKQAQVIYKYVLGFLHAVPMLSAMIQRQDSESIDLNNQVTIQIQTASFRSIRGFTCIGLLADEIAFWKSEDSTSPAEEILSAVKPAMAMIPTALLIGLSTPYRRLGPLWEAYRRHYGRDDSPVLVFQAETRTMNHLVPQSVIDQAYQDDPIAASAEFGAIFRSDVGTFLDPDVVEAAIEPGRYERASQSTINGQYVQYAAFCDPSGGRGDAFSLAIAHREGERVVLDVLHAVAPPCDPLRVVEEFCTTLKKYRCYSVTGDRYGSEWTVQTFARFGIYYRHSDLSRSELYLEALPLFASGAVRLLDHKKLRTELLGLERRTSRSGKDTIDHAPGSHDDLANAACGVAALLGSEESRTGYTMSLEDFYTGNWRDERSEETHWLF